MTMTILVTVGLFLAVGLPLLMIAYAMRQARKKKGLTAAAPATATQTPPPPPKKAKRVSLFTVESPIDGMMPMLASWVGHTTGILAFWLPALLITLPAWYVGGFWPAIDAAAFWSVFYLVWNWRPLPQQAVLATERFGFFWRVKRGWVLHTWLGIIDKVRDRTTYGIFKLNLFMDDTVPGKREEIDFADGVSAAVEASMWGSWGTLTDGWDVWLEHFLAMAYVYGGVKEAEGAAVQIAENLLRGPIQKKTYEEASHERVEIANGVKDILVTSLDGTGFCLRAKMPIVIDDIVLSDATKAIRQEAAKGEASGSELQLEMKAFEAAAGAQFDNTGKQVPGTGLTAKERRDTMMELRRIRMVEKMQGVNFVTGGVNALLNIPTGGSTAPAPSAPAQTGGTP